MPSETSVVSGNLSVEELRRELAEAYRREAASAEVLKVISRSTFDLQDVLDALVESASRLCGAADVSISRREGDRLLQAAHFGPIPNPVGYVTPAVRGTVTRLCVLERRAVHVADLQVEKVTYPEGSAIARELGHRTTLAVPLLREGAPLGAMTLRRAKVEPFTHKQIELATNFANQAVIAIENTRLVEELQASKRELQESLNYQTSISEVLGVISRSPTDVQPVFGTIAKSAARLCSALVCIVFRFDGKLIHFAASDGLDPEGEKNSRSEYPLPPCRASAATRAILNAAVEEIPDVVADPDYEHEGSANYFRSIVAVPMLKNGHPIGAIAVSRPEVGRFPKRQIELLETFADQAVIAIENARLFEAEQRSKRELAKSVEDLEIASQHKNQFVANMSHELRTPLAA